MASVKFQKGSEEWVMFNEYWSLCQKYYIPENNDEYWEKLVGVLEDFSTKYKNITLSKGLALAILNDLEKRHKETMKL